jgi:hypothetical protein
VERRLRQDHAAPASGIGPDVTQLGTTWVGAFSRTGGLQVTAAKGLVPRNVVQGDMNQAAQEIDTAIQSSP